MMRHWFRKTLARQGTRLLVSLLLCLIGVSLAQDSTPRIPEALLRRISPTQLRPQKTAGVVTPSVPVPPLFLEAPEYPTGHLPFSVATGDFNGDGKADLVVADGCAVPSCDPHQSAVSIHLGNGDGTFGAPQQYLAGFYANVVVVDDFNRDGKQDLAVADFCSDPQCSDPNGSISVLLGNGDGTFQSPLSYLTGSAPFGIAAEDLNGDGNEDLVTADTFQATISVLLGNGDGTFRPKVDYATDLTPIAVVIADFNGDHKLDVVTANYSPADAPGNLSILFGNGDGTFQPHQEFFNYLGNPSTVAAGDLNRDGNLDIVTTTTSCNVADSIVILFGNGDGTFPSGQVYFTGVNCGYGQVLLADFNGDNKFDIASLNTLGNAVSVFPGVGDGTFPLHSAWGTGVFPLAIAAGDFNGDGNLDLVAANNATDTVTILIGNGDNTFQSRIDSDTFVAPGLIASADFNQDGKVDLLTANGIYPTMSLLLGNGDGTFQPHVDLNLTGTFQIADLNLDGKPDLVVLTGSMSVLLGNGNGTFKPQVDYTVPPSLVALAIADFNGDGKPDVIVSYRGDTPTGLRIFLGKEDGTFAAPVDLAMASPGNVFAEDFNRDGKMDLLVCQDTELDFLAGNGDGTFQAPVVETNAAGLCPSFMGDLNLDGKPDLLAPSANGISVMVGSGDGTFQSPIETNLGGPATPNGVADLNGDGKVDVAVNQNNTVVVLLGNGDGTLQFQDAYAVSGGGWATVADFNSDGKPDVASTNGSADTVSVLLNIADIPMFTLSADFAGVGSGTVTINPGGLACSTNCSKRYATGTTATLSAAAKSGSTFSGWTGGGCSGTGTCSLTLTSDQTVTATFDLVPDFAIAASALTPAAVNPGQSSTSTVDVNAIAGFSNTVALTCSVSPTPQLAPKCSITPNSANPGTPATLTVTTTGPQAMLTPPSRASRLFYALLLPACGLTFVGTLIGGRSRKRNRLGIAFLALLLTGLLFQAACGGSSKRRGSPGTPNGKYTITVTGTSGSLRHAATLTLTVQ